MPTAGTEPHVSTGSNFWTSSVKCIFQSQRSSMIIQMDKECEKFSSMLDDIEHLPEHPPYFNEFPGNVRNMSFVDFSDILCDPYTDPRAQKTPLQSDSCYYQDSAYCASNTKASLSRTCSMSSDENQTIGDVQFNNNCCTNNLDVSSHPSVKQFSSCNTTDNMCNNNDLLCNSSESVCNNIDRMCSTNNPNRLCNSSTEQMCDNSNTPCNNANRIYNVSPPESPSACRWRNKHPENWTSQDVLDWLFYTAEKCDLDCGKLRAENFRSISGSDLCKLSIEDFERRETVYGGMLYSLFKQLRDGLIFSKPPDMPTEYMDLDHCVDDVFDAKGPQKPLFHINSDQGLFTYNNNLSDVPRYIESMKMDRSPGPYDFHPGFRYGCGNPPLQPLNEYPPFPPAHHQMNPCTSQNSQFLRRFPSTISQANRCSMHDNSQVPPPIQRRRPGRPRIKSLPTEEEAQREKKVKNQHLWEFIYEVLMNPLYNPQYVRWENQREGVFRFVQSEAVAQLWGSLKNNDNMTYEKLSRAMRHYYKRGILERVEGRRLVYKFSRVAMDRVREKRHSI